MSKTFCRANKDKRDKILEKKAKYKCKKCGVRVPKEKFACKPVKL